MRMPRRTLLSAAAFLLLAAACGERGETPEQRETRRAACIADELALQAKVRLANLDTALAQARGTPLENVTVSGHTFATAYAAFANRRLGETANMDSAARAANKADSVRYAGKAEPFRDARFAPGSVEANAADRWLQDFTAAAGNPDHPCNRAADEAES